MLSHLIHNSNSGGLSLGLQIEPSISLNFDFTSNVILIDRFQVIKFDPLNKMFPRIILGLSKPKRNNVSQVFATTQLFSLLLVFDIIANEKQNSLEIRQVRKTEPGLIPWRNYGF